MKLAFLFCVEAGWLEPQARLLVRSIRHFGGRYAQSPIHAVIARSGAPLKQETLSCFDELEVSLIDRGLNRQHAETGTANKVYAAAHCEQHSSAETLVFLDTDTVILNEPERLVRRAGQDLGLQLNTRGYGGTFGPEHKLECYWQDVIRVCEVAVPPYVDTLIGDRQVRGYYNGGLVAWRREAGLAARWLDFLNRITPITHERQRYMDQVSLAAVAASVPGCVEVLPRTYNYNIRERGEFRNDLDHMPLTDIVIAHYHKAFSRPEFLPRVRPALERDCAQYAWLNQHLPLEPVQKTWRHPWRDRLKKMFRW